MTIYDTPHRSITGRTNRKVIELKRDLVTSTAALAGLSSIAFGFLTNLPVALGYAMTSSFFPRPSS